MTDREMLELAAKAAGYKGRYADGVIWYRNPFGDEVGFNPAKDDGDSRRLQVALAIDLRFGVSDNFGPYVHARTEVRHDGVTDFHECYLLVNFYPDANAAARRAVLEVAAAIGKAMP